MTVTLRPLLPDDAGWLASWLPPLARALRYPREAAALTGASDAVAHVFARGHARSGVIVHQRDGARAIIELVAAAPGEARRGAGMAAAALLEQRLAGDGVRVLYAPVAETHGISMYFWIRLGYRPLRHGEWPCMRDGVAWLRRDAGRDAIRTA